MRRVAVAFGGGLVVIVAVLAITLSHAPITVAGTNSAKPTPLGPVTQKGGSCQLHETLPGGTSAIRLRIFASAGPRVQVNILSARHVITRGERGSGWTGGAVTVPLTPLRSTKANVSICWVLFLNGVESADLVGEKTLFASAAGQPPVQAARLVVEYLKPGPSSWWSILPQVARRMGLGHAPSGTWVVFLILALMGSVLLVCSRLVLRELR